MQRYSLFSSLQITRGEDHAYGLNHVYQTIVDHSCKPIKKHNEAIVDLLKKYHKL